jgi:hypothetical protein
MSDVQFEEEKMSNNRYVGMGEPPMMVKFLLKHGLVKDEKQANYVLIAVAVISVILTIWVIRNTFGFGVTQPSQNVFPGGVIPGSGQPSGL